MTLSRNWAAVSGGAVFVLGVRSPEYLAVCVFERNQAGESQSVIKLRSIESVVNRCIACQALAAL